MTTEERLRSLLEAATPGPWTVDDVTEGYFEDIDEEVDGPRPRIGWFRDCGVGKVDVGDFNTLSLADAQLIEGAVNSLPKLLAVVAAARAIIASWDAGDIEVIGIGGLDPMDNTRAALAALDEEGKR